MIILGKGASVDDINSEVFPGTFVIALNDAERIAPADVTIFHEDWVKQALVDSGLRSKLYVTSADFSPEGADVRRLPYEPLGNDTADLMMSRFVDRDDLVIEEVMLLTALEFARLVAMERKRTQKVYLLGFDFDPAKGYARAVSPDYGPGLSGDRTDGVQLQEHFLRNALYMLKDSDLDVVHVGDREFSTVTTSGFNARMAPKPVFSGDGEYEVPEVKITAEVTTNHFGDRDRLERLIREAHAAGADYVKFQKRDVNSFYTADQLKAPYVSPFGPTFGDYRHALELDRDDFAFIESLCQQLGIEWFASVLDQPSFEFMLDLGPALLKLPSTISEHKDYMSSVAANYKGPLVLSTGMTDQDYEKWVLDKFGDQEKLYLLHCNSAYPTPDQHCNIGVVRHYSELAKKHPNIVPGYSSHDHGWMASALAVAAGAGMVEKHVKLGNTDWAHFDAVALDLTTSQFKDYVENVRKAQILVGSSVKKITASEHHKYVVPKS